MSCLIWERREQRDLFTYFYSNLCFLNIKKKHTTNTGLSFVKELLPIIQVIITLFTNFEFA